MKKMTKEGRFLKEFSKIKLTPICEKYKIDRSNLQKGSSTHENEIKVTKAVLREIILLLVDVYLSDEIEVIENEKGKNTL